MSFAMAFGLIGGLALFIMGMRIMGDGSKTAGDRLRHMIEVDIKPTVGSSGGSFSDRSRTKQQCHDRDGGWVCQRWFDDLAAGGWHHYEC